MLWHKAQGAGGVGGGAAIELVATTSLQLNSGGDAQIITPAAVQSGDFIVIVAGHDLTNTLFSSTQINRVYSNTNDASLGVFAHFSSGETFYNITSSGDERGGVVLLAFRNVSAYELGAGSSADFSGTVSFAGDTVTTPGLPLAIVVNDDDEVTAVTQTGYTVLFNDFLGPGPSEDDGVNIAITLKDAPISSGAYTPPPMTLTGIGGTEDHADFWLVMS